MIATMTMTTPAKLIATDELTILPTAPQIKKPNGDKSEEMLAIPNTLPLNSSEGISKRMVVEMVLAHANEKPIKKKTMHNNIALLTKRMHI